MSPGNESVIATLAAGRTSLCVVWIMAGQDLWPAEVSDQSLRAFVNISHLQKIIKKRGKSTQERTAGLCQSDYLVAFAPEILSHFKT